jgi:hypothetical protein
MVAVVPGPRPLARLAALLGGALAAAIWLRGHRREPTPAPEPPPRLAAEPPAERLGRQPATGQVLREPGGASPQPVSPVDIVTVVDDLLLGER